MIYKGANNATNVAQRKSVQNKPCVDCGALDGKRITDHKEWLVKEHYRTGSIDKAKMLSLDAVQPQCIPCSQKQSVEARAYSMRMRKQIEVMNNINTKLGIKLIDGN